MFEILAADVSFDIQRLAVPLRDLDAVELRALADIGPGAVGARGRDVVERGVVGDRGGDAGAEGRRLLEVG